MRSKWLFLIVVTSVFLAVSNICFAQAASGATKATEQELIKLTQEVLQAEIQKDVPTMERLFANDFTHTHADGEFEKKADYINDIKTGKRNYELFEPNDLQVRVYGPSAVIIGHLHIKNVANGKRGDTQNSFMVTWVQQQGQWRMAAWATTRGPQPAAGSAGH